MEVVLAHCNLANSTYQKDSRVLFAFIPNKLYGSYLRFHHNFFI